MKAYLIDANQKTVSLIDLVDGLTEVRRLIGYDSIDSEEIDASGDRLFFDEGCFLRDQTGKGRFSSITWRRSLTRLLWQDQATPAPRSRTPRLTSRPCGVASTGCKALLRLDPVKSGP